MKSEIVFGDDKLKSEFEKLKEIKENKLYSQLVKAFGNLKEDAFCGIQIPKHLIPKEYLLASKEQGKAEGDRLFAEQKALIRNAIKGGMRKINGIEIFEEDRTSFRT